MDLPQRISDYERIQPRDAQSVLADGKLPLPHEVLGTQQIQ